MAAAEYFNPSGGQSYPSRPPPGPSVQNGSLNSQNPPYPLSDAPPPYTAFVEPRTHSQPPPRRPAGPADAIYRPAPPPTNGYLPEKSSRPPPPQMKDYYQYQQSPSAHQQQPTWQQQQQQQPQTYYPSQSGPTPQTMYKDDRKPAPSSPYRPSHSPHRESGRDHSRSRSRDRHRKHHSRPQPSRKKSSSVNTFLGAGGGALIGDAIFPGLGTLGGALLGGLGGHEYAKKRASSHPNQRRHRSDSNDFDYGYYNGDYYRRDDDHRRGRKG